MGKYRQNSRSRNYRRNYNRKMSEYPERSSTRRYRKIKKHRRYSRSSSINKKYSKSSSNSSYASHSSSSNSSCSSNSSSHNVAHFRFHKGQRLYHRYKIIRLMGDGTFGRVIQCRYQGKFYAIKVIKPVQRYIQSAQTERDIIKHINKQDPEDRYGIVRYKRSFYHNNHFCMVFKPLGKSLYEFIKMNNYKGFPINLVQSFFRQILRSVGFLHRIGYTHTDLKPQNILLESGKFYETNNRSNNQKYYIPSRDDIRIIDFGGATKYNQYHSSIINTRQYRSPQVILQSQKWDEISDVWSIGCIICELYTGDLFFPTHADEEHIAMIQKNCGPIPAEMVEKIPEKNSLKKLFRDGYVNLDRLEKNQLRNVAELKGLKQIFRDQPLLIDLLSKCLRIDPNRRINCEEALNHPFFSMRLAE